MLISRRQALGVMTAVTGLGVVELSGSGYAWAGTPKGDASVVPVLRTARPGQSGTHVLNLQRALASRRFWVGEPDGVYGHATTQAVMAVQKAAGVPRTGTFSSRTLAAVPGATVSWRSTKGRVVEIDRSRQLLKLVQDGKLVAVINTSTGKVPDCTTPTGRWRVFRRVNAWDTSPLGRLYRPMYFHRGYAIHGVANGGIPGEAASHGCARVSVAAMDFLWSRSGLRIADQVWVY